MTPSQVAGTETILAALSGWPTRWVAYGLATAFHEVGGTKQPVREGFKADDEAARAYAKKHYWTMKAGKPGYGRPAGPHGHVYYGRGYVQLTWLENYEKASRITGVDLVREPDRALEPLIAAKIMRDGMERGWFTGKKLSDYLSDTKSDYRGARRVINGTDKADKIAMYALAYEAALRAAGYGKPAPVPAVTPKAQPSPPAAVSIPKATAPPAQTPASAPRKGLWARIRQAWGT
jgi:hypothetical protein